MKARAAATPVALGAFVFVLFAPILLTSRVYYSRDLFSFWQPAVEAFVRSIAEGAWPLWSPGFGFGEPMAANPSFQIFYPPTWLNLLLPPAIFFKLYVVFHSLAGALGAAALARRLRAGRTGAAAAGMAWAASGALLSSIGMFHHFAGAAWMPWVVVATDRLLRRPSARRMVALAAVAAGAALAGSADLCFMSALVAAGWTLGAPSGPRAAVRAAPLLASAVVLCGLLAAVQWLPVLGLLSGTQRGAATAEPSLYWSLHPLSLLDAWLPWLTAAASSSGLLGAAARARLFESREPLLASTYIGLPASIAAACALLPPRRRRTALLLLAGALLFTAAALGRHAPLLPAAMRLPGVAIFRFPPKYLLPAGLLFSLLAGMGIGFLARGGPALRRTWIVAAGCLALALALAAAAAQGALPMALARALSDPQPPDGLVRPIMASAGQAVAWLASGAALLALAGAGRVRPRLAALVLAAASAGDLAWNARDVNRPLPGALTRYRPPIVDVLKKDTPPIRVYSRPYDQDLLNGAFVRVPAGWPSAAGWVLGWIDRVSPALCARWGLFGSYDGDLTGLAPGPMGDLSSRLQELASSPAGAIILRHGGVDAVVSLEADTFGGALLPGPAQPSVYAQPVFLSRVPDTLPKAFVAPRARVVTDAAEELRAMESPAYDPRREVIVAGLPSGPLPASAAPPSSVRPLWRRSDALAFEVSGEAPGYLVVLEGYERGWRARIDGVPAPVLRANVLFRAVPVPSGVHRVELLYRPPLVLWGALATAAGLALVGLVLVRAPRVR